MGAAGCGGDARRGRHVDLLLGLPRAAVVVPGIPEGKPAVDYVHPQLLTVGGDSRTVVFVHPPASVRFRITPAPGAHLVTAVGLDDGADGSDGARALVEVEEHSGGAPVLVAEARIEAAPVPQRRWVELQADLSRFAGREVTLVLRTEPGDRPENDWVGFASPQILSEGRVARRGRTGRTVVLASIDTLRVDVLGSHGDPRMLTPRIDAFTRQGELHPDASSPSHWTLPAHASLMASSYPDVLRVSAQRGIPRSAPLLAEAFAGAGWATAGFVTDVQWLDRRYGFHRGFGIYLPTFEPVATRTRRTRAWIEERSGDDVFLFFHAFEPHSDFGAVPYDAASATLARVAPMASSQPRCDSYRCASAELQRMNEAGTRYDGGAEEAMRQAYAAGVADADHELGRLLWELRGVRDPEKTIVALVSDHGEEIGDHGRYLHEQLYPELTRALLAVRGPGVAPGRLAPGLASLVDVAPTLLATAGIQAPRGFQGADLATARPRTSYSVGESGAVVVRDASRAVLCRPDGTLVAFERATDPSEEQPLPEEATSPLGREVLARQEAHRILASHVADGAPVAMSAEEIRRLESLGYTAGGAEEAP